MSEPPEIREAHSIKVAVCEFCPAVHIWLLDHAGEAFATSSLPADVKTIEGIVAALREHAATARMRGHAAPVRRQ